MTDLLQQEILKNGDKAKIISIKCLEKLKHDVEELKNNDLLNDYTKKIVNNRFNFDLPKCDFEIRSIIIVVSPSPIVRANFTLNSKKIQLTIPPAYIEMNSKPVDVEKYLNAFLNPQGYHAKYTSDLPQKMIAVRSGLCVYGRNNICYADGMGSLLAITTFYCDIPSAEEEWHELKQNDLCKNCKACLNSCPTKAITNESRMLSSNRCLTYFNESAEADFPAWIEPASHNCIVGCLKCQACCPYNKEYLKNIIEPVDFTEEETNYLLEGKPLEQFSEELTEKIRILDMFGYLKVFSRNLKVLIEVN